MHVLSIGSLYKVYFLLKHKDSPVPHATYISQDFLSYVYIQDIDCLHLSLCRYPPRPTRTSIAYWVQVDDELCDGLKDILDISNRAKCSEFSCNKLLRVNCSIITRTCTRRRCHIPLPCFRLTHLWEVFCVIASLSLKIFTKAGWSGTFFKIIF